MKLPQTLAALLVAATFLGSPAWAGEGHDHGDAAPAAVGQALPRFSAVSETFELVGVLSGKQITLYLDRFGDNSPVRGAQIELEIGGAKFKAEKQGEDEYEVVLPEAPKEGVLPVTATVTAGNEVDTFCQFIDRCALYRTFSLPPVLGIFIPTEGDPLAPSLNHHCQWILACRLRRGDDIHG